MSADGDLVTEGTDDPDGNESAADRRESGDVSAIDLVEAIVRREVRTVARTRTFVVLGVAFAAIAVGVARASGGASAGYVPTASDLLTPLELLVPVVAVAFGYRAVLGDASRGELDVLRTYPVSPGQFVLGTFLGRAVGLLVAIVLPLVAVLATVALTETPSVRVYATHAGADSPVLFLRVIVLTAAYALVVLAVAIAISAVANSARGALALAVVALLVLVFGVDLALVTGVRSGLIGDSWLVYALATSPNSAYRGLVLETAISVAAGTGPRTASPIASAVGLLVWTIGSLAVATHAVGRTS